jgi:hypothetical protein
MIDGLMNVMTPKAISADESDAKLEGAAIAGLAAIERIIGDRDDLRNRAITQQRELVALSAINEDLRRRITLIRHYYVELATKILGQLEQFDEAFREVMREKDDPGVSMEHNNLVALARGLRPHTVNPNPAERRDR